MLLLRAVKSLLRDMIYCKRPCLAEKLREATWFK